MITGKELKILRISARLTQEELAKKLGGYSKQTVSAIEGGRRNVGLEVASNWAEACGYELQVIFRRLEPSEPIPGNTSSQIINS